MLLFASRAVGLPLSFEFKLKSPSEMLTFCITIFIENLSIGIPKALGCDRVAIIRQGSRWLKGLKILLVIFRFNFIY